LQCDQTQPKCLRCQKRGAECVYRHLLTSYDPFGRQQEKNYIETSSRHVARAPPVRPYLTDMSSSESEDCKSQVLTVSPTSPMGTLMYPPTFSTLDHGEQRLLYHYMKNLTRKHMSPVMESQMFPILNPAITRNAAMNPYVQQAVLCYSALHLASSAGHSSSFERTRYVVAALDHKAAALAHFRPMLASGINAENCEAAFTASAVLVACAFALPLADPSDNTGCDRIELLAQVIGLFRGCVALFKLGWRGKDPLQNFRGTEKRQPPVVQTHNPELAWPEAERSIRVVIRVVQQQGESTRAERDRKIALLHAVTTLHKLICRVIDVRRDYSIVCQWLGKLSQEYAELLRCRDPLALVIMAHWCASRQQYSELIWWTRGWPDSSMASIVEALNGQYTELLGWCFSQMSVPPPLISGRHRFEEEGMAFRPWIPA
jgi:hypothetical protein